MSKAVAVKNEITLQDMVNQETENRKILTEFISNHLKEGRDYGSITIGGKPSKPSLFKAGAEKFGSLMKLRPDVVKDSDTWEMAGSVAGLFCYRCNLYNGKNEIVGMGLGACSIQEKKSANNAIKIAKKRAFVDAILTTGALSDFFTQDLEDGIHTEVSQYSQKPFVAQPSKSPYETMKVTDQKKLEINAALAEKGMSLLDIDKVLDFYNADHLKDLTQKQGDKLIEWIKKQPMKELKSDKIKEAEPEIDNDQVVKDMAKAEFNSK